MKSKLSVAYLTSTDPRDRRAWSGIHFQMLKALESEFEIVEALGPVELNLKAKIVDKIYRAWNKIFPNHKLSFEHSIFLRKYYANAFKQKLACKSYDVIYSPASSTQISLLDTSIPICYYGDTSFHQIADYYKVYSGFTKRSMQMSDETQQMALNNSMIIVHSSKWATDYVIDYYKIDRTTSFTVPMGANIDHAPDSSIFEQRLNNRQTLQLLLLGVDWERKGGPIAFDTMVKLNNQGIDAYLTVCGCIPPAGFSHPKLTVIPSLDKNKEDNYKRFLDLLIKTHFLLVPTRAEAFGIVFCEASAYGIPSISTDTGGVSGVIENDVNGYMLPLEATGYDYAEIIRQIWEDKDAYHKLVLSSRKKYDKELNWKIWGEQMRDIIEKLVLK